MYRPPAPRDRTGFEQFSWRSVLAGYAMMVAALASLWAVSHPVAGATVLVAGIALRAAVSRAAPRAAAVVRCLRVCREFTVDLGGKIRITVTKAPIDDAA